MPLDLATLAEISASADFDRLVGEVENEWFDCESQPYRTAMANSPLWNRHVPELFARLLATVTSKRLPAVCEF